MSSDTSSADRQALVGAVLAGGRSARMGRPKAGVELAGRPLVAYAIDAVAGAGLEPIVIAKLESELPALDCRIVHDGDPRPHPAAGILAALEVADGPVVVVACDMPLVPAQLVTVLAQLAVPVALPMLGNRLHPLLARYEPEVAPALESAVESGEPLRDAIAQLDPLVLGADELAGFGDLEWIAFNVNDPGDLATAERLMSPAPSR